MAKDKKKRDLRCGFSFDGDQSEYDFQIRKKPNLWWLLLLLLPLVLLIPLKKDITVITQVDGIPEPYVDVSMSHTGKYLLWDWRFLVDRPFDTIQQTDAEGKTVFKDLGYSVYSYIFHHKDMIVFNAGGDCYETVTEAYRFHKMLRKVILNMEPKSVDVRLKVVDLEMGFEIPRATVEVEYDGRSGHVTVVDSTDAAGYVTVRDVKMCSGIERIKASADGYADTLFVNPDMSELMEEADGYQIPLRPLKDRFTFFVKNKYTRQPIPDALAEVTLTLNGQVGSVGHSHTNVDGLGQGFFDNARVLAKVEITASKRPEYLDGRFVSPSGRVLTVREFKVLPDSLRVVWLVPEPQTVEFRNVDTLTGQPIAGVKNEILIEGIDGTTRITVVTSNRDGCFPVKALPDDKITIKSTCDPNYQPKTTVVDKLRAGQNEVDIPLKKKPTGPVPHTGDVQILLSWSNFNDLDLSCIDPYGNQVWFQNKKVPSGGELDIDMNASVKSRNAIENIYWPTGGAPEGKYTVYITFYAKKDNVLETPYTVKVKNGETENTYTGVITRVKQKIKVCTFYFSRNN